MKSTILAIAAAVFALGSAAVAHEAVERGPNGGRLLEFSTDETIHGEVVAKDGVFHIELLDKDQKPVKIAGQSLTATTGERSKPQKLTVEVKDGKFTVPMQKGEDFWVIFQYRNTGDAKVVTARLHYDASICSGCKKGEWLCECKAEGDDKKEDKDAKKEDKHDHDHDDHDHEHEKKAEKKVEKKKTK